MLRLVPKDDWVVYDSNDPYYVIGGMTRAEAETLVAADPGRWIPSTVDNHKCRLAEDHP